MIFNVLLISISLSIDSFGIGVAYKLKGVHIGFAAKIVIGVLSGIIMWLSLNIGEYMSIVLPETVTNLVGVSILILMGVVFIRNSLFSDETATYDFDHSKKIDGFEAFILAFALSADSISAGIAIAAIGIDTSYVPVLVGLSQVAFLSIGNILMEKCGMFKVINSKVCGVFSGILLILIALLRGI